VQTIVEPDGDDFRARVCSATPGRPGSAARWELHATCTIATGRGELPPRVDLESIARRCRERVGGAEFFAAMAGAGFDLRDGFRWLEELWCGDREALARLRAPVAGRDVHPSPFGPGSLDACFQLVAAVVPEEMRRGLGAGEIIVPLAVDELRVEGTWDGVVSAHVRVRSADLEVGHVTADIDVFDDTGRAVVAIRGVRVGRVARELLQPGRHAPAAPLRQLRWQRQATPAADRVGADRWAVVGSSDTAAALADHLRASGAHVQLADAIEAVDVGSVARVVEVSAIETGAPEDPVRPVELALRAARAIAEAGAAAPRLWLVSANGCAARPDDVVDPAQAALIGFANTLALEHTELWGGLVDVERAAAPTERAVAIAQAIGGQDFVAIRGCDLYVPRLSDVPERPGSSWSIDPDASYVVTGGWGALGLVAAAWLVDRGARTVVLAGRTGPSPEGQRRIDELGARGARLWVEEVDIADPDAVERLVDRVRRECPPLRGVIHAAGVLDDVAVLSQDRARLERVFAPKAVGAWNLHRATARDELDLFVMFSSAAAILGSPGQSNYAAANAYLDGLAQMRTARGLPAVSIAWGPWADQGMAARTDNASRLGAIEPIEPAQGVRYLEAALSHGIAHVTAAIVDWATWRAAGGAVRAYVSAIAGATVPPRRPLGRGMSLTVESLRALAPEQRPDALTTELRDAVASVLRVGPDEVDPDRSTHELGLDSLMGLEVKNQIERRFGVTLAPIVLFRGPSVRELAGRILELLETEAPPFASDDPLAGLDYLDDHQVDAMLAALMTGNNV
jgi:acyl carrier protein